MKKLSGAKDNMVILRKQPPEVFYKESAKQRGWHGQRGYVGGVGSVRAWVAWVTYVRGFECVVGQILTWVAWVHKISAWVKKNGAGGVGQNFGVSVKKV